MNINFPEAQSPPTNTTTKQPSLSFDVQKPRLVGYRDHTSYNMQVKYCLLRR